MNDDGRRATVRRVLTGTNERGEAVIACDELVGFAQETPVRGFPLLALSVPAGERPAPAAEPWPTWYPAPEDLHAKVLEMPAGWTGEMHATATVDIVFVLSGEITAILDGGDEATIGPGDFF